MNDWDVLKSTVEPDLPTIDFEYTPRSMYLPISGEGTVHLGYSCYAQQWLSEGAPTGLPDGAVWANQLPQGTEERTRWEEASQKDWENLLTLRANEVVVGGILVFHIQSSMCCGGLSENAATILQQAKLKMISDGELSEKQARCVVAPEYQKSPVEVLAKLSSGPNQLL